MSAKAAEALLARLFTDADLRGEFLRDPHAVVDRSGLDATEAEAFVKIDRTGLQMAAESYARKRAGA
jgi:hypothetical protein